MLFLHIPLPMRARTEVFEGQFKKDQAHGNGVLTHISGEKFEGVWVEGEMKEEVESSAESAGKGVSYAPEL